MEKAAETLILPFEQLWQSMAGQVSAWEVVWKSIALSGGLSGQLRAIREGTESISGPGKFPFILSTLENSAVEHSKLIQEKLKPNINAMTYPMLVGNWAVIEAGFEDLIVRILINDKDSVAKAKEAGVRISEPAVKDLKWGHWAYRRIERAVHGQGKVVETHRLILGVFGAPLDFEEGPAALLDEINQARNCILHRNGLIDEAACEKAPRLSKYLDAKLPADDPLFQVSLTIMQSYTVAWIRALMRSPYLKDGLLPQYR